MLQSEVSSTGIRSITGRVLEGVLEGGGIGLPVEGVIYVGSSAHVWHMQSTVQPISRIQLCSLLLCRGRDPLNIEQS